MGYAGDVLFSAKQRGHGTEESPATLSRLTGDIGSKALGRRAASRAEGSLLKRSVKGLVIGGLAASWGYSLGGLESGAGRTADVARGFGGFARGDVGIVPVGGVAKGRDVGVQTTVSSCVQGLLVGGAGSLIAQNPLPLLVGLGGCLSSVSAQQRIGNEFQVNTYTAADQRRPSAASFDNGNFVVVWESWGQDSSGWGIYGQLFYENATRFGSEFQINTHTSSNQQSAVNSVASFSNGNFVVIWNSEGQDGSSNGVYGLLFSSNATRIGNEFQVNSYVTNDQFMEAVDVFNDDNFVVTWQSQYQDGSGYGVYGQIFYANSTKLGGEFQVNTYTTGDQLDLSVAVSNGNFIVVWTSDNQDGSGYGIYGQLFSGNADRIGDEFLINNYTTDHQIDPHVASLSNGNFVVIWHSHGQDGSGYGVYGQLFYENATRFGSEFQANTYTNMWQGASFVKTFIHGGFVVVWQSDGQDGSGYGIYGQLFYGNGSKLGNEFQVNTYTNNAQEWPSIEVFDNNNFVVTWTSWGQDSSDYGIFGQLFEGPLITSSTISTTSETTTSSNVLSTTSNQPTSSTDLTTMISSATSNNVISSTTTSSTFLATIGTSGSSLASIFPNSSISSSELITTSIPSTENSEITGTEESGSNAGAIVGIVLGIGGGCGLIVLLTYLYLNKKKAENKEGVSLGDLEDNSKEEEILYANAPKKPEEDEYANYPQGAKKEIQYANAPKGSQENEYANIPSKTE